MEMLKIINNKIGIYMNDTQKRAITRQLETIETFPLWKRIAMFLIAIIALPFIVLYMWIRHPVKCLNVMTKEIKNK
jgi:hypothetical protein